MSRLQRQISLLFFKAVVLFGVASRDRCAVISSWRVRTTSPIDQNCTLWVARGELFALRKRPTEMYMQTLLAYTKFERAKILCNLQICRFFLGDGLPPPSGGNRVVLMSLVERSDVCPFLSSTDKIIRQLLNKFPTVGQSSGGEFVAAFTVSFQCTYIRVKTG